MPQAAMIIFTSIPMRKRAVLPGVFGDDFLASAAVRHPAGVSEIANILAGKLPQELPHHGQAAKPGVEYADGAVIHTARGIILVYCFQNPTPSSPPAGRPVLSAIRI